MELAIAEEPIEVRYRDHTTYCEQTMPPTCNDYGIVRTVCCEVGAPQMKRQRGGRRKMREDMQVGLQEEEEETSSLEHDLALNMA